MGYKHISERFHGQSWDNLLRGESPFLLFRLGGSLALASAASFVLASALWLGRRVKLTSRRVLLNSALEDPDAVEDATRRASALASGRACFLGKRVDAVVITGTGAVESSRVVDRLRGGGTLNTSLVSIRPTNRFIVGLSAIPLSASDSLRRADLSSDMRLRLRILKGLGSGTSREDSAAEAVDDGKSFVRWC